MGNQGFELKGSTNQGSSLCSIEKLNSMIDMSRSNASVQLFSSNNIVDGQFQHQTKVANEQVDNSLDALLVEFEDVFQISTS